MKGRQRLDLTGERFGRLAVQEYAGQNHRSQSMWKCICDCGVIKTLRGHDLKHGSTNSCGCLGRELAGNRARTHGMTKTRAYSIWNSMRSRCLNPKATGYRNYGARGITICARWDKFELFYEDMGPPPDGMTLDRINNDLGYSKENCRWASDDEQANNSRSNVRVTAFGETKTVAQFARDYGIKYVTLHARINRMRLSPEDAINYRRQT